MKKFLVGILVAMMFTVFGCGSGQETTPSQYTTAEQNGYVAVPSDVDASNLEVVTLGGFAQVQQDGSFEAKLPEETVSFIVVRDSETHKAVYYAYLFPGEEAIIDDYSTALTLAMMNPLFFAASLEQKIEIAEKITSHERFNCLVEKIETARAENFYNALDPVYNREIFVDAKQIAVLAIAENARDYTPPSFEEQATGIDSDAAWIESAGGLNMRFRNPKMIYYAAGSYSDGVLADTYPPLILPKEKIIDFSIWPPSFEIVEPRATPYVMPGSGLYTVKIFKGIQFDMPVEDLWNTEPARVALLANTWLTVQMIVSLCGDIGILPGGSVGVDILFELIGGVPADWIYDLYQAIDSGDVMDVINVFVDFFKNNSDMIAGLVSGSFSSGSSDPAAASSLISSAGDLVGIATSLFDVVNSEIPFFYDLITAHSNASYKVNNGVVQLPSGSSSSSNNDSDDSCSTVKYNSSVWYIAIILLTVAIIRRKNLVNEQSR